VFDISARISALTPGSASSQRFPTGCVVAHCPNVVFAAAQGHRIRHPRQPNSVRIEAGAHGTWLQIRVARNRQEQFDDID
jgi:hypothetical protein